MSDPLESPHLKLPYLAPSQAQKHVTHNEALRRLDAIVQLAVLDADRTGPPAEPEEGDRHIVAEGAAGAWAGRDGDIAAFIDGAWAFVTPEEGWLAFDIAAETILVRRAEAWQPFGPGLGNPEMLGINATPDATNRLAVRSEAVLFSGVEEEDGGTGDIRFVVNKHADADTATLLFQSAWSGRAEVGLAGDTDFVFKVSADGDTWIEAIRIDKDTGLPSILYDNSVSGLGATTVQDAIDEVAAASGGGGGAVASVFGRTGAVVAAAGDYEASEIDNDSGVSGASVKDALDALDSTLDALDGELDVLDAALAGKQAADADLTALAGLSATGLLARTGAGTAAARTLVAGNGLTGSNLGGVAGNPTLDVGARTGISVASDAVAIDKASDANVRAAASNKVLTADLIESASAAATITDGASPTFDWDAGINFVWTLGANRTLPNAANGQPGTWRTIEATQDANGTRTLAYGNQYVFPGGTAPVIATGNGAKSRLTIYCRASTLFEVYAPGIGLAAP